MEWSQACQKARSWMLDHKYYEFPDGTWAIPPGYEADAAIMLAEYIAEMEVE